MAISSHIISFQFFADFRTLADDSGKPKSVVEAEELTITGEKICLSQKETVLEPIKKKPCILLITGEPVTAGTL